MHNIMDGSKILIFVETKRGADELTKEMRLSGWPALAIHGDKRQEERDWVLKEFKEGRNPILIVGAVLRPSRNSGGASRCFFKSSESTRGSGGFGTHL